MPKKLLGFAVVAILIIASLLMVGVFLLTRMPGTPSITSILLPNATPLPTQYPSEFAPLTIPYLRGRSYASHLSELTKYADHATYTSYLTSYDSDGLNINGLLTIPSTGSGPWPAIVFVHGYIAPTIYKTTERYMDYVDYLARNGFVVFKIDLRGHGDSEGEPSGAYYSGDYIIDTLNAYSALQNAAFVNASKVGIWGHSMAGNVTFRSFTARQNIPALVIWAGAVYTYDDLASYRLNDNSYRPPPTNTNRARQRQRLRDAFGDYSADSAFWQDVVPTNFLDGVGGAIQIHHAINDDVVNINYSRDLMGILDNTSIAHELFEYPSGGHNLTGTSFTTAMQRTVEFFKENLR